MTNAEIRKNQAIADILAMFPHGKADAEALRMTEKAHRVSLLDEGHCVSAWTARTPVVKNFTRMI